MLHHGRTLHGFIRSISKERVGAMTGRSDHFHRCSFKKSPVSGPVEQGEGSLTGLAGMDAKHGVGCAKAKVPMINRCHPQNG
jgi:hypothetical protein